ncbi:phenylphosphate carboxylase subunit beta [Desulfosporosinus lacus]|uniref:4-hydroxy-3-polyprenylbenzoate decarboxylase n=1 Tax=Desulfosporosinus lacus DSM 15449 TaxID=1121420 RepID=A0A1M5Z058_9FIRM|nr:phenylphosphate carboxylase subunit beta [Desulfosporosinus lacus]SHI17646.1 4-hydroxy-3-polyprenylbenzoate decarboxylase [Desulfosporosinus lacus DSM 15449]
MPNENLRDFISELEKNGELLRIKNEVDWNLELSHIAKVNEEKTGPALLFENVKDYKGGKVFVGALSSTKRLAIAMNMPIETTQTQMARAWVDRCKTLIPPVYVATGAVKENIDIGDDVDLFKFPVPKFYERDGGRYIGTFATCITKDPETGWINLGTYRMQMLDKNTVGVMFIKGKHGDLHRKKYIGLNKPMQVAVVIGYDPLMFLASSTTISAGEDEYNYIGALRGSAVEVVKGEYVDLPIPANAEMVLEGELWPEELRAEGPFGEYTGYYSGVGTTPRHYINVKAVTYRNDMIFHSTTVGRPVTDTHMIQAMNRTATLWSDLEQMKVPGIQSVYVPPESSGRYMAVVSVKCMYPGHSDHVGNAVIATTTGSYGFKVIVVVDEDIPADDMGRVLWAMTTRMNPLRGCQIISRARSTPLDPSLPIGARDITSRIIMDCTIPYEWKEKPTNITLSEPVLEVVKEKWNEYGFKDAFSYKA